jgi:hypothetical protein
MFGIAPLQCIEGLAAFGTMMLLSNSDARLKSKILCNHLYSFVTRKSSLPVFHSWHCLKDHHFEDIVKQCLLKRSTCSETQFEGIKANSLEGTISNGR